MNEILSRICFSFIAMATPLISWASKNPIVMHFYSQLAKRKFTTIAKISWPPFDIQRSKVHVVVMHSTKASCTYFLKVLFNNVGRMSSMKPFWMGSSPLSTNEELIFATKWIQLFFNGKKTLTTNNVTSSKNLFWVS